MNLSNLRLQAILDEAAEDNKKKKKADEADSEENVEGNANENETPEEDPPVEGEEQPEEQSEEGNPDGEEKDPNIDPESEGDEPETQTEDSPTEGEGAEEGSGDEGETVTGEEPEGDDFSLDDDPEGEDDGPAPDGLPEADDDGSSDMDNGDEPIETNIQTNILNLSRLDRAIAKRTCYQMFMDLRSTVSSTINMIDRNETVIDPDVRESANTALTKIQKQLNDFLMYKFQIVNYEDALMSYFIFVKQVNAQIEYVKNDGITKK